MNLVKKQEDFNKKEQVFVKGMPGLWRIIEIASKNKCTLKEENGFKVMVKDIKFLIKTGQN